MGSALILLAVLGGCQEDESQVYGENENTTAAAINSAYFNLSVDEALASNRADHEEDADASYDASTATRITMSSSSISVEGSGVTVDGSVVTITEPGTYIVSGSLSNGQLAVATESEETVKIVLDGVNLTYSSNAPFAVLKAEKVVVFLEDGTINTFSDTENYVFAEGEDEPNATFYSKANLSFYGTGTLQVNSNYNDGISSKDGMLIAGGNFVVNSVDDGIRGKDYLVIRGGNFEVNSDGDAFKSDNDEDEDRGYILIGGGEFDVVTTAGDGFSAETDLLVKAGTFDLVTGGGVAGYNDDISAKALKAGVSLILEGGEFEIDAADDGLHSNTNLVVHGGTFKIATGDDGVHADAEVTLNDGEITVSESYEALEGTVITINGGTQHLTASDDGINAAGEAGERFLYFQGGYTFVKAGGDGIDSNGSIAMTDGTVIVNGPTSGGNGVLDFDGRFQVSGGTLIAAGTSNMAQAPGTSSEQNTVAIFVSQQAANTPIAIQDGEGNNVLVYAPTVNYSFLVFSSPNLKDSGSYTAYVGGTASGTVADGLYSSPSYTRGTAVGSFTITSNLTVVNR